MATQEITLSDLQQFKQELLTEIQHLIKDQQHSASPRWVKSKEILQILNVSPGTLQRMRANGELPFTKINRCIFYDLAEINHRLASQQKRNTNLM